jgi:hypothetical protein
MKIAAVVVPIALLVVPTLLIMLLSMRQIVKGKNKSKARPIGGRRRKLFLFSACSYLVVFIASICWAIYVYVGNKWLVALCFIWTLFILTISILHSRRLASRMPKRPPEGFQNDQAALEFENKKADIYSEDFNNSIRSTGIALKPFAWLLVIIIVIIIALGILAAVVSHFH